MHVRPCITHSRHCGHYTSTPRHSFWPFYHIRLSMIPGLRYGTSFWCEEPAKRSGVGCGGVLSIARKTRCADPPTDFPPPPLVLSPPPPSPPPAAIEPGCCNANAQPFGFYSTQCCERNTLHIVEGVQCGTSRSDPGIIVPSTLQNAPPCTFFLLVTSHHLSNFAR